MHPYLKKLRDEDAPLRFDEGRAALLETLPLLGRLEATEQDPIWHAEGDVATHTRMVLEELEAALARGEHDLDARQRFLVRVATLFHDIAKPLTTTRRIKDGRECVVAPRHAERGASYLAYRGLDLGLEREDLFEIMGLVRHHHDPKFLIIKDRPHRSYWKLARGASARALHALEMADMRGRTCEDRQEQIDFIELFALGAKEAGTWSGPLPQREFLARTRDMVLEAGMDDDRAERAIMEGLWALEAGDIFTPEEAMARSYALDERFCRVVMTMGPSGCGKSTWVERHFPDHGVIALDGLREELTGEASDQSKNLEIAHLARERLKEHLRREEDVVWDATNLRREFRAPITGISRDYKAHVTLVLFHMSPDIFFERNRSRSRKVPTAILERQLDGLNWPEFGEAHRVIVVDSRGLVVSDSRNHWLEA